MRTSWTVSLPAILLFSVAPAALAESSIVAGQADTVKKPNIIYIMLDDAGWGDFGAFGSPHVKTPTFDRVCDEGTRFTQHYSGSAVCAPTRCVLMTGLHTGHCRRRDNTAVASLDDFEGRPLVFLEPVDVTVAEVMKEAGYVTAGIGKWGLGNPGSTGEPGKQGFDHWFGYLDQVHAHDYYTDWLWRDGQAVPVPGNQGNNQATYAHDLFEQETLAFLRANRDRPFFLYLAYTLPHGKYVIPQDDPACQLYQDQPWPQQVRNYAAMITRADRTVGEVLGLLEEMGIDDRTIVFYTSDNGPNAPFLGPLNSAGGLRGTKRQLYEGGIRAAMAVRWPGNVPAGRTSDFAWSMVDVFPTVCDLAGVDPPQNLDGISVLPTLLGREQTPHEYLYWEIHHPFQQAVRTGRWKAIRLGTAEPLELYDLSDDPAETRNVAAEHPDVVHKVEAYLATARTESRYWPAVEKRATRKRGKKPKRQGKKG
jgi:arylsulfatase A-like enzyme